uniref:Uncharacterized protein n=1 Tax=Triticum urartu TaxID=4572 RepID=A0A8R7UE67_TRIUA
MIIVFLYPVHSYCALAPIYIFWINNCSLSLSCRKTITNVKILILVRTINY